MVVSFKHISKGCNASIDAFAKHVLGLPRELFFFFMQAPSFALPILLVEKSTIKGGVYVFSSFFWVVKPL